MEMKSKVEKIDFHSENLDKEMSMLVYLPECYNNNKPLPVLYFFHGRNGNENLLYHIEMNTIADKMINEKEIEPLIIVCPRIENSRGINSSKVYKEVAESGANACINLGMYEDYFINEVIPLIDMKYNTIKDRTGRFVGGVSGGGYTALHNALRHQDMFIKTGGHMPAIELILEEEDKPFFNNIETWAKYDPVSIAKNNTIMPDLKIFLDAGDEDEGRFYEGCEVLYKTLLKKGIDTQNYIYPGHHNAGYIKANLEKYLKFYGS